MLAVAKQKRNAPNAGQPNYGVQNPANHGGGPAKGVGDDIKLKQAHKRPVERTDDYQ